MKKVLSTLKSGSKTALIGFSLVLALAAQAMTASDLETAVTQDGSVSSKEYKAIQKAHRAKLKADLAAGKDVDMGELGRYKARKKSSTRTSSGAVAGHEFDTFTRVEGEVKTFDQQIKDVAADTGLDEAKVRSVMTKRNAAIQTTLNKGGSVALRGEGNFKVAKVAQRTYKNKAGEVTKVVKRHKQVKAKNGQHVFVGKKF